MLTEATVTPGSKPWADDLSNPTFCMLNTLSHHIQFAQPLPCEILTWGIRSKMEKLVASAQGFMNSSVASTNSIDEAPRGCIVAYHSAYSVP